MKKDDKPIEKIYQKKSQLEHILLRPDAYIGSDEMQKEKLWVFNILENKLEYREVNYVPGLFKIFDEILVNAADNFQRDRNSMTYVKVWIDQENNRITVRNNGKGIPVEIHKEYDMYVPELIFGHLLTSSNYNDDEKKVTGGRNGYGAKLTNIFSKLFMVETADLNKKRHFKQTYKNNMSVKSAPEVKEGYSKEEFTQITFEPDLAKFKMTRLDEDIIALMTKRVYDLAGVTPTAVKVYLNDKKIDVKNFSSYVDMYLSTTSTDEEREVPKVFDNPHERWEVAVSLSDGQFQQVSYVNSISTSKGGTHVNYVTEKVVNYVLESIQKKNKKLTIKSHNVKQHLWIFVNCLIENPSFDSQTKENMTLKPSSFGSSFDFSEKFLKDVIKTGIVDHCVSFAKAREELKMTKQLNAGGKKTGRLLGIPKLDDANNAGTKNSHLCTLILTEGDSAKSLAMSGIEIVGRDNFGVFPLRGKLLNVREANNIQITNNEEIQNLIKILGLQVGKTYEEVKNLRYGSIMIMTDQDHDGSHIKGLIINFIHHFWPSLIKMNGFLKEFITPIIKATKGSEVKSFYTIPEYKKWIDTLGGNVKNWNIKYYKGLGTSTQREAQEYFSQIVKHKIEFFYENEQDDDSIDLAFNKKKAEDRKIWLANFDTNDVLEDSYSHLKYEDFINKEFILFSMADNLRSIPSVVDGLKPSERKILFACFKKKLKGEIKVAQLVGYVSEHSAYHHGEMSLSSTIVAMAQNFVGSNNINLLMPIGMFGTRNYGGKDSASARYIFTSLSKVTRHIFNENDDPLMDFIVEEGQKIEPHWYLPTLPMVLVNGAEGIGTGWSTNIPCYNPREIVDNIKNKIKTGSFFEMKPWYKGFLGTIEKSAKKDNYTITGKFEWNEDTLVITELPLKKWTKDYNEYLESLMGIEPSKKEDKDKGKDKNKKKKNDPKEEEEESKVTVILEDIRQYHTNNRVHFEVKFLPEYLDEYKENPNKVIKTFKLQKNLACTNMVCFDNNHKLRRYNEVDEILQEFFDIRLEYYAKRKEYMLSILKRDLEILDNKQRFIILIVEDKLVVRKKKKTEIVNEMYKLGFTPMSKINQIRIASKLEPDIPVVNSEENPNEEEEEEGAVKAREYDYLLSMPLWSLTLEKVSELLKNKEEKVKEIEILNKTDEKDIWQNDMAEFLRVLEDVEIKEEEDRVGGNKLKRANNKGAAAKKPRAKNKTKEDLTDDEPADKKVNMKKQNEKAMEKSTTKGEKTEKKTTNGGGKSNVSENPFIEASHKVQESKVIEAAPDISKLSLKERLAIKTKRKFIFFLKFFIFLNFRFF